MQAGKVMFRYWSPQADGIIAAAFSCGNIILLQSRYTRERLSAERGTAFYLMFK